MNQDGGGAAVGYLEGEVPCGAVGVGPCHADVGTDPGGDDDEARVAGAERGVVPDVEVEERDVGYGGADAPEEGHAHGLLRPGQAERGERLRRRPDQHVLGERQAARADHGGYVGLVGSCGVGGGEEEEEEEWREEALVGHGGWRREADGGRKKKRRRQVAPAVWYSCVLLQNTIPKQ